MSEIIRENIGTGTCVKNRLKCRNQYSSNDKSILTTIRELVYVHLIMRGIVAYKRED